MQWHSVGEFFEMGGYALYVWGSFGACALAMVVEPWLLRRQRQRIEASLKRQRLAEGVAMRWTAVQAEVTR
jgi:heme exporter protein D